MPDLTTLRQRLTGAEDALHNLMIGEREVSVTVSDYGATTFSQVNRKDLERYIADLKNQIAVITGRSARRPIYVRF